MAFLVNKYHKTFHSSHIIRSCREKSLKSINVTLKINKCNYKCNLLKQKTFYYILSACYVKLSSSTQLFEFLMSSNRSILIKILSYYCVRGILRAWIYLLHYNKITLL